MNTPRKVIKLRNKKTGGTISLVKKPSAPKFKPRDRTKKPGGSNKYV